MKLIKKGLFWRIDVGEGMISKKRFLTRRGATVYYYEHQNRDGFRIVEAKK